MNAMMLMLCVLGILEPNDWTPVIATEGAMVTLEKSVPTPLPQPKPDPDGAGATGQSVTGPLDTLRDAKELIRKGNDLADQSVAILDQARRDGKITVDIRLPKSMAADKATPPTPRKTCPGGACPHLPSWSASTTGDNPASTPTPDAANTPTRQACKGGVCRSRLFWRFRR
jgi:hypothetical protein